MERDRRVRRLDVETAYNDTLLHGVLNGPLPKVGREWDRHDRFDPAEDEVLEHRDLGGAVELSGAAALDLCSALLTCGCRSIDQGLGARALEMDQSSQRTRCSPYWLA